MASVMYNAGMAKLGEGSIDWNTDTIKLALCTTTYTPDVDSHDFFNDITNELSTANGYTAGGFTLTCSVTQDNTNNRAIYDAVDLQNTVTGITFRYGIVYKSTGVAGTSPLICLIDFTGSGNQTINGIWDVTWSTAGVFTLTAA